VQLAFVIPRLASGKAAGLERWIRIALIANGCLIPFLALQMYWPPLIWGGALWAITFPAATWLLAVHFGRIEELP
jgi:hypothetical protein